MVIYDGTVFFHATLCKIPVCVFGVPVEKVAFCKIRAYSEDIEKVWNGIRRTRETRKKSYGIRDFDIGPDAGIPESNVQDAGLILLSYRRGIRETRSINDQTTGERCAVIANYYGIFHFIREYE